MSKSKRISKNKNNHKGEKQFARSVANNNGIWRGKKASSYKTYKSKKKIKEPAFKIGSFGQPENKEIKK